MPSLGCLAATVAVALFLAGCQASPAPAGSPPPVAEEQAASGSVASPGATGSPEVTPSPVAVKVQPEMAKGRPDAPVTLYDFSDFR
jgi:hypothetical protein